MGRQRWAAATATVAAMAMAIAMAVGALGCKGDKKSAPSSEQASSSQQAAAPAPNGGARPLSAGCASSLSGLDMLAAENRVAELVRACTPCDTAPILLERRGMKRTASYLADLDASVAACGGFCTKLARMEFGRNVQAQLDSGEPSARPWRELAAACPEAIGQREDSRGYLGATWFLLERIAHAAEREHAGPLSVAEKAPFPLPAVASEGRGLELPSAPSAEVAGAMKLPGRLVITVLAADVMIGRLPWGKLTRAGVAVDGEYPGISLAQTQGTLRNALETVEAKLASAAIAPQKEALPSTAPPPPPPGSESPHADAPSAAAPPTATIEDFPRGATPPPSHGTVEIPVPSLAAPYGLPAARLVEVLTLLGRPARLLVQPASPLPDYAPPMVLAPIVTVVGLYNARTVAMSDAAAIDAIAADPRGPAMPLILQLGAETTVEEVALAVTKLASHPIVGLAAAPAAPAAAAPAKATKPKKP